MTLLAGLFFLFLRLLTRFRDRCESLYARVFSAVLNPRQKSALTVFIYNLRHPYAQQGLFPWEKSWFERRLPVGRAKILVGGCGAGREVAAILERGCSVDAFDPARALIKLAAEKTGGKARLGRCSYQDFSTGALPQGFSAPYDGLLLGWGSLSHLLSSEDHRALFTASQKICPVGPILASFLTASDGRSRTGFLPALGFVYYFSREEIEALGAHIGRRVTWEGGEAPVYAHATFTV